MEENRNIIEEVTIEEDTGKVNISDEVVASIAGIAANEIDGVSAIPSGVVGGIAEKLGAKKNNQKGVKVLVTEDGATIDLYITVAFGKRIPELAWEVQENVKNSVETMTGINVLKVNVHVNNVAFEKEEKPAKKEKPAKSKPSDVQEVSPAEETPE